MVVDVVVGMTQAVRSAPLRQHARQRMASSLHAAVNTASSFDARAAHARRCTRAARRHLVRRPQARRAAL
jgi:hypothetical protein